MRLRATIVLLLAVSGGYALTAQQPPEQERGFEPGSVHQFSGFDSVNLFNGNLNLAVPIASYSVSSDVSYSFVLRYTGNVWNANEHCTPGHEGEDPVCGTRYFPQRDNAGMGWSMEFQELIAAVPSTLFPGTAATLWRFKSSDSGEHFLFDTLHEPKCEGSVTTNCDPVTAGVRYSRDGTYIRMKDGLGGAKVLEFPSGERRRFVQATSSSPWLLQYIYGTSSTLDSNGVPLTNWVKYEYPNSATHSGVVDWRITDSHGREHMINFQPGSAVGTDVVDKMRLAAFKRPEDASASAAFAQYNLTYDDYSMNGSEPVDGSPSVVPKPCQALFTNTASVRFLARIDLPTGETWEFSYFKPTTACDDASATLIQATLPTRGKVDWTYQSYGFDSDTADRATGVLERRQSDALGNQIQYTKYLVGTGPNGGAPYTTTVETYGKTGGSWKRDSRVVNYFDRSSGPTLSLPFTATLSDPAKPSLKLSSETFDCDVTTSVCSSTPERRRYVTYEMDYVQVNATLNCNFDYPCARDRNRRVLSERTRYVTDGDRYAETDNSLFDGLGHYRKAVTGGTFSSGNVQTTETNYNSHSRGGGSVGVYALTASGTRAPGYTSLLFSDPWILGTYGNAYTLENDVRTDVVACFDPMTGFLKRQRTLAGPTNEARANDLLGVFTRDSGSGYASREEYFGGDKREGGEPNLSLGDLCTLTPASHDKYSFRIDHTYQYGALKTSAYVRADGTQMPFLSKQNTLDSNTGLVASSTDAAGAVTSYRYDRARRLDLIDKAAGGLADTSYTYVKAAASTPPSVTVTTGTGLTRTSIKYEFDSTGRVWREHHLMPDESWSVIETTYDALGQKASVSEKETYTGSSFAPANKTVFSGYDPFGRVGSIVSPDQKTTTIAYAGDRLTTRTTNVATSVGGVTPAVTIEERDRAGRLVKVTENTSDVTTYEYTGDLLSKVTMGAQPSRLFNYDGRGLLMSERHPESGTTTYQYDARGHVVKRIGAAATLTTDYDRAERVLSVFHEGVGLLKEFEYDRVNAGTDYSMGKLAEATRHNRSAALGDVMVKETYTYATRLGLLSRKDTAINTVKNNVTTPGGEFFDKYEYTDLGDLRKVTYPACDTCAGTPGPLRVVDTTLTHGLITSVGPYTTSMTYHPNAALHEIQHANVGMTGVGSADGPLYTQTIANGMARTDTISVTNFCTDTNLRIDAHPESGTTVSPSGSANLTVVAPGATQWQWYKVVGSSSIAISGQTTNTLTSPVAAESTYWVRVGNGNCSMDSNQAVVLVAACPTVTLSVDGSSSIPQGGSKTIHVNITGTASSWTIQWSDLAQSSSTSLSSFDRVVTPSATKQYTLTILPSAGCGQSVSNPITVTVVPPAPTAVTATAVLTSRVDVSWSFSGQADQFNIERKGPGQSSFTQVGSVNSPATSYADNSAAANTAYLYRVKAVKAGTPSAASGVDLATTVIFDPDPIGFLTVVSAQPIMQLRTAVNAVRALWNTGIGPFVFIDASLSGAQPKAAHILELRSVLDDARTGLGLPAVQYTSPPPALQQLFKTADINDLRGGVR